MPCTCAIRGCRTGGTASSCSCVKKHSSCSNACACRGTCNNPNNPSPSTKPVSPSWWWKSISWCWNMLWNTMLWCWKAILWIFSQYKLQILGFLVIIVAWSLFGFWQQEASIESFGGCQDVVLPRRIFERDEVDALVALFNTTEESNRYHLVSGEHGTGKTTAVIKACQKKGVGVLYFPIDGDQVQDFPYYLAKAVRFSPTHDMTVWEIVQWRLNLIPLKKIQLNLASVMEYIREIALKYRKKYGVPPVLVLDNINILAQDDPKALLKLERKAKRFADERLLIFVFVSSEGSGPRDLESHSEWSRSSKVVEIGDLDRESAISYLISKGISPDSALETVNITGGRFVHLELALDLMNRGEAVDDIRKKLLEDVEKEFGRADLILPNHNVPIPNNVCLVWNLLEKLLDNEEVSYRVFLGEKIPLEYLSYNVFAYHPTTNSISLQSLAVKLFVKSEIGIPDSEERTRYLEQMKRCI